MATKSADLPACLQPGYRYEFFLEEMPSHGEFIQGVMAMGCGLYRSNVRLKLYGIQPQVEHAGRHLHHLLMENKLPYEGPLKCEARFVVETKRDRCGRYSRDMGVVWGWTGSVPVNINQLALREGLYLEKYA
jgi:hypothetical protein